MVCMDLHEIRHLHLSEMLPVGSQELWSAHHMEKEEVEGEKQRLVHRPLLSHVSSLALSHCARGWWREGVWGGSPRQSSPQTKGLFYLQEDESGYL